jgi:asparagine synthase (glutamine-hydrolysing)
MVTMCGINGILNHDRQQTVEEEQLQRMRQAQSHRGPDDSGIWMSRNVGFGFDRLAIIDIAGGHQPMTSEDGAVALVFNGEIYNFQDLRKELIGHGWTFRTNSDTEVLLRAWQQWGEQCVDHLRGMFAFVLWDVRRSLLFGARDRLGIKPLYYWAGPRSFAFASELKALLQFEDVPRELDPMALEEFLRRRYVIAPATILRDVLKLPPGHWFKVCDGKLQIQRYWQLPDRKVRHVKERDAIEELRALMDETIREHLISDVPLGAFLSGGLDSSCTVAWMSRHCGGRLKTFSVGYDAPESELPYARRVADHFGTDHHELFFTAKDFRDAFSRVVWHMDEPVGDEASAPLFLLADFARSHVVVALSGEGSDEIFGGYSNYRRHIKFSDLNAIPGVSYASRAIFGLFPDRLRSYAEIVGVPLENRYHGVSKVYSAEGARTIMKEPPSSVSQRIPAIYGQCSRQGALDRMAFLDINSWLPDDLLVKADRMTMASSLELRVPFLDHKVVEFAWQLPASLKIRGEIAKYILKKAVEPIIPHDIVHRQKVGFAVPLEAWFRGELSGFVRDTLLSPNGVGEYLHMSAITDVLEQHRHQDRSSQIYPLLALDQWCRQFLPRVPR